MNKLKKGSYALLSALMVLSCLNIRAEQSKIVASTEENVSVDIMGENVRKVTFNNDWKFALGDVNAAPKDFNDNSWRTLNLPHDWSIEQEFTERGEAESGFLLGGVGWYRKSFVVPQKYSDKSIVIDFDGVYMNAEVYVNGKKLGVHPYGYTAFAFDLSDSLICDGKTDNVIAIRVENNVPSSRWYSGSGIYRDVNLTVTDKIHVARNGTVVTTPDLASQKNGPVQVNLETTLNNDTENEQSVKVKSTIINHDGKVVSESIVNETTLPAKESKMIPQQAVVQKPALWSVAAPEQYTLKTEVLSGDKVIDTYETSFGFRYFAFDRNTGFSLNGENLKLQGTCMHHDQGALGAVANERAIERQVQKLKDMGCNAIRVTHNPAAKVLLDVCDRLGMLVIDEAFDGWALPKNGNSNDFSKYFNVKIADDNQIMDGESNQTWAEFDTKAMVNNAKNAPSVIMWSIGNEIAEGSGYDNKYPDYARNIIKWVQEEDATRPVTIGDNNTKNGDAMYRQISTIVAEAGGIVGLNYSNASSNQYQTLLNNNPNWTIYGSETSSAIRSRGIYTTKGRDNASMQITAYDKLAVGWGQSAQTAWKDVITRDYVAGEFIWTGFDYIGEPTPWNGTSTGSASGQGPAPKSSYFGMLDTAGLEKDIYYFYQSQWNKGITTLHVLPCWNKDSIIVENGNAEVVVYSNAPKVELFLNGTSLGTKTMSKKTTAQGHSYYADTNGNLSLTWNVPYAEGTLSAKAYDEKGNVISETSGRNAVSTSKGADHLNVIADRTEIKADGKDLAYITVDVCDENDVLVPNAKNKVDFEISGNGKLVGVDNGDATDTDSYKGTSRKAFSGKLVVIVQSTQKEGDFTLTAKSNGLASGSVRVNTKRDASQEDNYMKSYRIAKHYYVNKGQEPSLPMSVEATFANGDTERFDILWDAYDKDLLKTPQVFKVNGTLKGTDVNVNVSVHVIDDIIAIQNYAGFTYAGVELQLPKTLPGIASDGTINEEFAVTWDTSKVDWNTPGIYKATGIASVVDKTLPVSASIRITKALEAVGNIALNTNADAPKLTESCINKSDSLASINNGITNNGSDTNQRWTNYNDMGRNEMAYVTMDWSKQYEMNKVDLYLFTDGYSAQFFPSLVSFAYWNGSEYVDIPYSNTTPVSYTSGETTYLFTQPITTNKLRIGLKSVDAQHCIGLTEAKVYNYIKEETPFTSAELESISLDGKRLEGFMPNVFDYTVKKDRGYPEVSANSSEHSAITILPSTNNKTVILVTSEDRKTTNTYTINYEFNPIELSDAQKAVLQTFIDKANAVLAKDYSRDDYESIQQALNQAKATLGEGIYEEEAYNQLLVIIQKAEVIIDNNKLPGGDVGDKTELRVVIKEAKALQSSNYTPESWAKVAVALEEAITIEADIDATQAMVNEALSTLKQAISELKENTVMAKEILISAINKALAAEASEEFKTVVPLVQELIRSTRMAAQTVYADANATNDQCIEAWIKLTDALHYLDFVTMDKTELLSLINVCKEINTDDYQEGVEEFKAALEKAITVYENENALAETVQNAYDELKAAKENLVENETGDKTMLISLVENIEKNIGDGSKYKQDDAYQAMSKALAEAKAVLANQAATQAEINSAFHTLATAYENIRLLPSEEQLAQLQSFLQAVKKMNRKNFSKEQLEIIDETAAKANSMLEDFDEKGFADLANEMAVTLKMINDGEAKNPNQPITPTKPDPAPASASANTGDYSNVTGAMMMILLSGCIIYGIQRRKKIASRS